MQTKTDKIKPKTFPYTFYLMDEKQEKSYDEALFRSLGEFNFLTNLYFSILSNYKGPVYWNDCGRDFIVDQNQPKENFEPENMHKLVYSSLKPLLIHAGGEEVKPLTPRLMCEAVAKVSQSEASILVTF